MVLLIPSEILKEDKLECEVEARITSRSVSPDVDPVIKDKAEEKCENVIKENQTSENAETTEAYEIVEIPGKGTGVLVTRNIFPGEVIMVEEPWLVVPDDIFEDTEKTEEFLDKKLNNMGSDKIAQFLSLTDCRNPSEPSYTGIFYTNDMNYDGDAALFPTMARVNHSCCANAEFVSRKDLGVQRLVAMYPIQKGAEIVINYLPMSEEGSDIRSTRQHYLLKWYGFRCTCVVCTLQEDDVAANDEMREEIQQLLSAGLPNLDVHEIQLLVNRMYQINGKLSFILDIMDAAYRKTAGGLDRYLVGVRGLELAILVHGEDSNIAKEWRPRVKPDLWEIAEIWAPYG